MSERRGHCSLSCRSRATFFERTRLATFGVDSVFRSGFHGSVGLLLLLLQLLHQRAEPARRTGS